MIEANKHTLLAASPQLGGGVFLVTDISSILRIPYSKVRHWLNEFWDEEFGKQHGGYSFGDAKNRAVNFHTLLEFYAFYKLREKGLSSQRIRKAHDEISRMLNTPYPFASTLRTDGSHIWYEHLEECVRVDGKKQIALKKVLEPFLDKIEFGDDNMARCFFPIGKNREVVVDPHHQFGQPTIRGTNIKVETIYQLYMGGETKKSITALYNLNAKQVNDALRYFNIAA
jgi:uncharacterized protein (DUF433 family)